MFENMFARLAVVLLTALLCLGTARAQAPQPGFAELSASQAAANATPGARRSPALVIPVPTQDVSPEMQAIIAAPYRARLNLTPNDTSGWKALAKAYAATVTPMVPVLKQKLGVTVEATKIAGVNVFIVNPAKLHPNNSNRLLMNIHGGAYVFFGGEEGLPEAMMLAGIGGYKVVAVDYRMPPDFPFPAAMDDVMAVWNELLKTNKPSNMGVFGTSTGGAMTLALVLRAKVEKVPLPAAIAAGTPWSDIDKVGDSYFTNEWIDNGVVSWDVMLGKAALLYANGHDLKDPQISPIYGDFSGFPPAILTSGTRDLFLSNTVRTHRKLRRAGVIADLNVYEGQSHAQYAWPGTPENLEAFADIARFFDTHLGH